jgi:hypothetical protein
MSVYIRILMFKKQTATVITCLFKNSISHPGNNGC